MNSLLTETNFLAAHTFTYQDLVEQQADSDAARFTKLKNKDSAVELIRQATHDWIEDLQPTLEQLSRKTDIRASDDFHYLGPRNRYPYFDDDITLLKVNGIARAALQTVSENGTSFIDALEIGIQSLDRERVIEMEGQPFPINLGHVLMMHGTRRYFGEIKVASSSSPTTSDVPYILDSLGFETVEGCRFDKVIRSSELRI